MSGFRKANRMIGSLSHDAAKPSSGDVVATVQVPHSICRHNATDIISAVEVPVDASAKLSVERILGVTNIAKVCYSVVRGVVVNMVNNIGLGSVNKEPRKPVTAHLLAFVPNPDVSRSVRVASFVASFNSASAVGSYLPSKVARCGIVINHISDRVWDNVLSHIVLPHGLVRGAVVGATVTPDYIRPLTCECEI